MASIRELQREHDRLMRRSRNAEDAGFDGTAREAAEAAAAIARQIDDQDAPRPWCTTAHP